MATDLDYLKNKFLGIPPTIPPVLPLAPPSGDYDERQAIADLLADGYKVLVANPWGEAFNTKYTVFTETFRGKEVVAVNEYGQIVGMQG